jgi:hypothetical protein|eukprot:Stramenopile-MAST_4_protein_3882
MAGMAAGGGEVAGLVNGQMNDAMLNIVKDMVVEQTSNTLLAEEERLDGMMKKLDNLDEDTLERMREARKRRMQKQADERHKLKQKGHGTYTEISGDKEFFAALKDCPAAAIHFYRSGNERCDIMDKHMNILARKYIEAKFLKINAEKCQYVCQKLNIWCLPSVVLVKGGKTEYTLVGFNDMRCEDDFKTEEMAYVLGNKGIIDYKGPDPEELGEQGGAKRGIEKHQKRSFRQRDDSDSDLSA